MLKLMLCTFRMFGRGHKQAGCKAVSDDSMNIWLGVLSVTCFKLLFIKLLLLINITMADYSLLIYITLLV